jgi:hypothetical protein
MRNTVPALVAILAMLTLSSCSRGELHKHSLDFLDGVITRNNVAIDEEIKAQGKGSLRISAPVSTVVELFEKKDVDATDVKLVYSARLRTEDLKGKAYLEMLIFFPDGRKNFSRSLKSALSGTSGWKEESVSFPLEKGLKPSAVKLGLVIDGTGTVWVDDVKLVKSPL